MLMKIVALPILMNTIHRPYLLIILNYLDVDSMYPYNIMEILSYDFNIYDDDDDDDDD